MLRFLLATLVAAPAALAQGGFAPFALPGLPVSTHEAGAGQALAAGPSDNPYVLRHNPALLADAGERPALRLSNGLAPDLFGLDNQLIASSSASIGIDVGEIGGGSLRIGIGGGYAQYRLSGLLVTDPQGIALGEYDTQEREIIGGLALGWDGPVHVRVGASAAARESFEQPVDFARPLTFGRDRATTLDLGAAVSYPILRGPSEPNQTAPEVEITGAYVYQNAAVLAEDFFVRPPSDVLSESFPTAPLGAQTVGGSVRASLVRQLGRRGEFRLVEADARTEILTFDDRPDETRLAGTLVLGETLALRAGYTDTDDPFASVGAELRIGGMVRAIGAARGSASMLALADRLTTRFEVAVLRVGEEFGETTYYGTTVGWRP